MKMKLPNSIPGSDYYSHDVNIIPYFSDGSDSSGTDDIESSTQDGDFSEYLWMENEEEFDEQVMKQLEEEALMEQCIEAMLDDEHDNLQQNLPSANVTTLTPNAYYQPWSSVIGNNIGNNIDIVQSMGNLCVSEQLVIQSNLNPNALEFVPRQRSSVPVVSVGSKA